MVDEDPQAALHLSNSRRGVPGLDPEEIALAFTLAANIKAWEKQIETEDSKSVCRELLAKIETVKKGCPHTVCYDEEGFIYFPRTCVQCGWGTLI